jgi:hypothetical protein
MVRLTWIGALALAACSTETGILVGVSGSSVEELVFQVGVAEGSDFVLDQAVSGQSRDVRGRDLRLDPYELLLRPEAPEAPPREVRVLVLGQRGGKVVSFAVMEPPQVFLVGEVLRRGLVLVGVSSSLTAGPVGRCYQARPSEKASFRLIARGDRDCDGVSPDDSPPDCDDGNSAIHPGAKEICDGKDNNCDGKLFAGTESCYALTGAATLPCREGKRSCEEGSGKPVMTACDATESSAPAPRGYCGGGKVVSRQAACTVETTGEGASAKLCAGGLPLESLGLEEPCSWSLIADGGWPLSLGGTPAPATVQGCKPVLSVPEGPVPAKGTAVLELEAHEGTSTVYTITRASFAAKPVASCSAEPIQCVVP